MTDPAHYIWRRYLWPMISMHKRNNKVPKITENYVAVLNRIRLHNQNRLKVVFLVNELAKWKYQSVYDVLKADPCFEVIIALTCADIDWELSIGDRYAKFLENKRYFERNKMRVVSVYDYDNDCAKGLDPLEPDIVFYQQPWLLAQEQTPMAVSKYALTLYAPYFVPTELNIEVEFQEFFHQALYLYFVLNKEWERGFYGSCKKLKYAGNVMAVGHPMLDTIFDATNKTSHGDYVIYAPHWSIPQLKNRFNIGTFMETGFAMLEYAKSHKDVKWVFKPHPTLRSCLYQVMSHNDVDNYYSEWESLGQSCYTNDYPNLFANSRAMITDCASFLVEYACTRKPIIHLVGVGCDRQMRSPFKGLYSTYYAVHGPADLYETLNTIVLAGEDPLKDSRISELRKSGLLDCCAAEKISTYMKSLLKND